MGVKRLPFPTSPLPLRIWKTQLVQDGNQIQIEAMAYFLIISKLTWNILFLTKMKILILVKCSYRSSQFCWLLTLEELAYIWACRLISFKNMSFWCPFLDPHLPNKHRFSRSWVMTHNFKSWLHNWTLVRIKSVSYCMFYDIVKAGAEYFNIKSMNLILTVWK